MIKFDVENIQIQDPSLKKVVKCFCIVKFSGFIEQWHSNKIYWCYFCFLFFFVVNKELKIVMFANLTRKMMAFYMYDDVGRS